MFVLINQKLWIFKEVNVILRKLGKWSCQVVVCIVEVRTKKEISVWYTEEQERRNRALRVCAALVHIRAAGSGSHVSEDGLSAERYMKWGAEIKTSRQKNLRIRTAKKDECD